MTVCNDSVRLINLPNTNAVRKFICVQEEITENKAILTDFHKVKVVSWVKTPTTPQSLGCFMIIVIVLKYG